MVKRFVYPVLELSKEFAMPLFSLVQRQGKCIHAPKHLQDFGTICIANYINRHCVSPNAVLSCFRQIIVSHPLVLARVPSERKFPVDEFDNRRYSLLPVDNFTARLLRRFVNVFMKIELRKRKVSYDRIDEVAFGCRRP
ncbi:hypothetical protein CBM2631_A90300 [Cupriavidus taiwanensis]|nr:hypothetical protein CBM2631_A90300 [Cupriavidus taiwanensis]